VGFAMRGSGARRGPNSVFLVAPNQVTKTWGEDAGHH
jgi:hypothetical protein